MYQKRSRYVLKNVIVHSYVVLCLCCCCFRSRQQVAVWRRAMWFSVIIPVQAAVTSQTSPSSLLYASNKHCLTLSSLFISCSLTGLYRVFLCRCFVTVWARPCSLWPVGVITLILGASLQAQCLLTPLRYSRRAPSSRHSNWWRVECFRRKVRGSRVVSSGVCIVCSRSSLSFVCHFSCDWGTGGTSAVPRLLWDAQSSWQPVGPAGPGGSQSEGLPTGGGVDWQLRSGGGPGVHGLHSGVYILHCVYWQFNVAVNKHVCCMCVE